MTTRLVQAIEEGDLDAVQSALDSAGEEVAAAVNKEDPGTWLSPLHHAARLGAVEVAKLLLEKGADPNLEDIKGRTCLHVACDAYAADETGDFLRGRGGKGGKEYRHSSREPLSLPPESLLARRKKKKSLCGPLFVCLSHKLNDELKTEETLACVWWNAEMKKIKMRRVRSINPNNPDEEVRRGASLPRVWRT